MAAPATAAATASIASQDSSLLPAVQTGAMSSVESSLREFQWQLQLRDRLQSVFSSIRKHFYLQNVCCAQVWLSASGCRQEQNLGQMQLYADPNLMLLGDADFASFRQLSCQALLPGRHGMPGRAWIGGCVQVVQNLAIIPSCLHPRTRLAPALAAHVAEVVYITVYDPARPRVGPVAVLEALFSARSTDSMMVANFISFVGSALLQTQLTLCDPAPKPFTTSKLAGRKPVLVSEPDVFSQLAPAHAAAVAAAEAEAQAVAAGAAAGSAGEAAKTSAAAAAASDATAVKQPQSATTAAAGADLEQQPEAEADEGTADNDVLPTASPAAALLRSSSVAGTPASAWPADLQLHAQAAAAAASATPPPPAAAGCMSKPLSSVATDPAAAAAAVAAVAALSHLSDATAMGPPPAVSVHSTGGSALMPAPRSKRPAASREHEAAGGEEDAPPAKRLARLGSMGRTKSIPVDLHTLGEVASTASSKPQLAL